MKIRVTVMSRNSAFEPYVIDDVVSIQKYGDTVILVHMTDDGPKSNEYSVSTVAITAMV